MSLTNFKNFLDSLQVMGNKLSEEIQDSGIQQQFIDFNKNIRESVENSKLTQEQEKNIENLTDPQKYLKDLLDR